MNRAPLVAPLHLYMYHFAKAKEVRKGGSDARRASRRVFSLINYFEFIVNRVVTRKIGNSGNLQELDNTIVNTGNNCKNEV